MSLLERIACNDGDPQRSISALRLINDRLAREMAQCALPSRANLCPNGSGLLARLRQSEIEQTSCRGGQVERDEEVGDGHRHVSVASDRRLPAAMG